MPSETAWFGFDVLATSAFGVAYGIPSSLIDFSEGNILRGIGTITAGTGLSYAFSKMGASPAAMSGARFVLARASVAAVANPVGLFVAGTIAAVIVADMVSDQKPKRDGSFDLFGSNRSSYSLGS